MLLFFFAAVSIYNFYNMHYYSIIEFDQLQSPHNNVKYDWSFNGKSYKQNIHSIWLNRYDSNILQQKKNQYPDYFNWVFCELNYTGKYKTQENKK